MTTHLHGAGLRGLFSRCVSTLATEDAASVGIKGNRLTSGTAEFDNCADLNASITDLRELEGELGE